MKPPSDALGNELFQGALVGIKVGDQFFCGNITFLSNGGIALATGAKQQPQQTPGQLVITIQVPLLFAPESKIGVIYRLIDPNAQAAIEQAAKQAAENANKPFVVPGQSE
jgi:hypothetical protein